MIDSLKYEYCELFGDILPTIELTYMTDNEIENLLKKCIKEKKDIYNFISVPKENIII